MHWDGMEYNNEDHKKMLDTQATYIFTTHT